MGSQHAFLHDVDPALPGRSRVLARHVLTPNTLPSPLSHTGVQDHTGPHVADHPTAGGRGVGCGQVSHFQEGRAREDGRAHRDWRHRHSHHKHRKLPRVSTKFGVGGWQNCTDWSLQPVRLLRVRLCTISNVLSCAMLSWKKCLYVLVSCFQPRASYPRARAPKCWPAILPCIVKQCTHSILI